MKTLLFFLIFSVSLVHAQDKVVKDIGSERNLKEQYINVSREKLALEIDARKLKEQLKELEQKNKELSQENKDLEKEISTLEKELTSTDLAKDELEKKNQSLQGTLNQINQVLRKN